MQPFYLLNAPSDVIIRILCYLQVKDILSIEQTCKDLHDLAATRQVWLTQLENLDRSCAPDLPPHIDIDTLSSDELRELVVNASRIYQNCLRGVAQYVRKTTIDLGDTMDALYSMKDENVRLSPGSQYLFVQDCRARFKIFDLRNNNACVWSYKLQGSQIFVAWSPYAFEICRDGTITLMLAIANDGDDNGLSWCIEVRRLIPSGNANRDFQSHLAYSCGCGGETELTYARPESPYVAVESSTGLIVINWKDRCRAHIMIDRPLHVVDMKILHNFLFICNTVENQHERPATFSVVNLDWLSKFSGLAKESVVDLKDVASSTLTFTIGRRASIQRTMAVYSKDSCRRSYAISLFGGQRNDAIQQLISFELIYRPDSSSTIPSQPSLLLTTRAETLPSAENRHAGGLPGVLPGITESLCGLLLDDVTTADYFHFEEEQIANERKYIKFGVKPEGSFFFAPLSQEIQKYMKQDMRLRNRFMEYHSGALVISRDGRSIDIWYPA